jgi:hypothetical protein
MTAAEALALAKNIARQEGWPWLEPVEIRCRRKYVWWGARRWLIKTNRDSLGCNAWFQIDDRPAAIMAKGF